ncbi:MAG: filamentous hemagglutinin, partial [Cyanobacteria bacterium P01_F01_bin.143]
FEIFETTEILNNLEDRTGIIADANINATGNGGDINIDTNFIVTTPNQNSDIVANALQGSGGNINISAEAIFGIEERPLNDITNDINASSEFGLDGNVSIDTPDINRLQTDIELPNSIVETQQNVSQACQSDRTSDEPRGLTIKGKGGLPPQPTEPFESDSILVDGEIKTPNLQTQSPEIKPIATSIGDIYPARGIIKTEEGKIILTAYVTDNLNTRTPHNSTNCNSLNNAKNR